MKSTSESIRRTSKEYDNVQHLSRLIMQMSTEHESCKIHVSYQKMYPRLLFCGIPYFITCLSSGATSYVLSTKPVNMGDDSDVMSLLVIALELPSAIPLNLPRAKDHFVSCASKNPRLSALTVQRHRVFLSML